MPTDGARVSLPLHVSASIQGAGRGNGGVRINYNFNEQMYSTIFMSTGPSHALQYMSSHIFWYRQRHISNGICF